MAVNALLGMADGLATGQGVWLCPGVVPVLVGPLQVLLTLLPGILVAVFGGLLGLFRPSGFKKGVKLLWRQKAAAVCIVAVGAGIFLGVRQLWPGSGSDLVTTVQEGHDWPTARFDLGRRGFVPGSLSPTRSTLVWSSKPDGHGFLSSPAVVGNRVYIASANIGAFSKTGAIHCLDADTGAVVWSSAPPDYRATFSSPVVSGRYLVCGEGLHDTRDARVVCLDVGERGAVLWTFRTKNHVECTPVIADGRVFVGAGDDGYYCLALEPGADGEPTVYWHKPGADYPDAETSIAVHDGKVYAGLGNTGKALVVLDALTGAELHRLPMPYPVFSPPSIDEDKLYLGMGNGDYVVSGAGGEVRCLDLATLKTLWSFELPQTVLGAVAVTDDKLYFGCNDHHVYCVNKSGKLLKKFNTHAPIKTSPAVTDQHVFVVNDTGNLFALDRHTLEPVFADYRLGTGGLFISSPAVARGHVYVGTQTDGVLCVGKPASTKRVAYWPAPLGGAGVAGNADGSPLPGVGAAAWRLAEHVPAAPAVWDSALFVPVSGPKRHGLLSLLLAEADKAAPVPDWCYDTEQEPHGSPVILGNIVAVASGRHGDAGRRLHFLDRLGGNRLQVHPIEPSSNAVLTATPHQFLIQDGVDNLTSFDPEPSKKWSVTIGRLIHAPAFNDSMIVAAVVGPDAVVALDRATGLELWRVPLSSAAVATPLLDKATFLLATQQGIVKRSLVDGSVDGTWSAQGGVPSGAIAVAGQQLVFINGQGEAVVLDRDTGRATLKAPGAAPGTTPLASRGMALFAAPGRLMSFLVSDELPLAEPWVEWPADAKDAVALALVLRDGRLYVALGERGLVCVGTAP